MKADRKTNILIGLCIAAAILLGKIFYIQVIDKDYKDVAQTNAMVHVPVYPTRGIIYDRNGKILVGNKVCYDLMVTPRETKEFDTLKLAEVLGVEKEMIKAKMDEFKKNAWRIGWQPVCLMKQISPEVYMKFAEVAYKFPTFYGQVRSIRQYPFNAGGNLLGYVSEVDKKFLDTHEGYKSGDYAGKTGLEAAREADLKGVKGDIVYLRDSRNRIAGHYMDGALDKEAVPGNDITTTIDADLQKYGQELMTNKVGSLVAIEPSTGEILTLVSSPGIDVDILADIGSHYKEVVTDPYKPMFNRAVQASYPPGSVFKLVNCLIGLQEGVLTPETMYPCSKGYHFGNNRKLGCHAHKSPINMEESIMMSCNAYYCYVLRSILDNKKYSDIGEALDTWKEYVESFGFGKKLGSDFPAEGKGNIPGSKYYDKVYRKGGWKSLTVISLSIGQGEIGCTPLHLANLCATVANRGFYYIPHIVKDSEGITIDEKYHEKQYTKVDTSNFKKVINGMSRAVNSNYTGGTASIAAIPGIEVCGKTGTAQNPRGADNSVFICFAPRENPQIAVAAYVENGGFGAAYAAPIASLLVEKYLTGEVKRADLDQRMRSANLMSRVKKD